jgi:tRNA 2-thiouridine synthesizing protein A
MADECKNGTPGRFSGQQNGRDENLMADHLLDARMLNCPEPIILTRQALSKLQAGEILLVLATDPGAVLDFQAFCRISGNELLEMDEQADVYRFRIRKSTAAE